jgi:predicted alpha/beta superfamily hydrolase
MCPVNQAAQHQNGNYNPMLTLDLFTPEDDDRPVFLTGSFNAWTIRDDRFKMEKVKSGHYQYTFEAIAKDQNLFEYKYVKGGWESEELDQEGHPPSNRKMESPKGKVSDVVPRWKKHDNTYDAAFYPDIRIVAQKFNIPQLRRKRRISVLLPWNYEKTTRKYPVLYLQDGQNLFEPEAPFGTWGVDKQLAMLAKQGFGDFIVVAIDHGGRERIREFSPYTSEKWGIGQGRDYARFMAETLKPFIDKEFRTLTARENTALGGSSMGGLISIYGGLMYPEIYSKFMIFSPSLWVSPKLYFETIRFSTLSPTRIYLYAGGREGAAMVANATRFKNTIEKKGYDPEVVRLHLEVDPAGRHNEARWGEEFPKAAKWLFYA